MTTEPIDFDSPWKNILEQYLQDFMAFFFHDANAAIDWDRGYTFLDKELLQIVREAEVGRRLADKLVQVWRLDGEEAWVLIHIEVQNQEEADFAERMYTYHPRARSAHTMAPSPCRQPNTQTPASADQAHAGVLNHRKGATFPMITTTNVHHPDFGLSPRHAARYRLSVIGYRLCESPSVLAVVDAEWRDLPGDRG